MDSETTDGNLLKSASPKTDRKILSPKTKTADGTKNNALSAKKARSKNVKAPATDKPKSTASTAKIETKTAAANRKSNGAADGQLPMSDTSTSKTAPTAAAKSGNKPTTTSKAASAKASAAHIQKRSTSSWLMQRFGSVIGQDLAQDSFGDKEDHHHHFSENEDSNDDYDNQSTISSQDSNDERHQRNGGRASIEGNGNESAAGQTQFHKSSFVQQLGKASSKPLKDKDGPLVTTSEKRASDDKDFESKDGQPRPAPQRSINVVEVLVKLINILFPLFFLALGILHLIRNGWAIAVPANFNGYVYFPDVVSAINSAAITMWGIMFAAIAGQSLKAYATYSAERGIKLMSLEQLLHSQSFSSAIKQPLSLRRIDATSILLFLLWALSPLANQALQKMSTYGVITKPVSVNVTTLALTYGKEFTSHCDTTIVGSCPPIPEGFTYGATNEHIPGYTPLYASTVTRGDISPNASMWDIWGNPRIPLVANFNTSGTVGSDWIFANNSIYSGLEYTSLVGIPVSGYNTSGVTDFEIQTDYFLFDCSKPMISTPSVFDPTMVGIYNTTAAAIGSQFATQSQTLFMSQNSSGPSYSNGTITWVSIGNTKINDVDGDGRGGKSKYEWITITPSTNLTYSLCSFKAVHVSNHVICSPDSGSSSPCYIDKVRILKDQWQGAPVSDDLVMDFLLANYGTQISLAEAYMYDPSTVLKTTSAIGTPAYIVGDDLIAMDRATFSLRLQTMFNTVYQLQYAQSIPNVFFDRNLTLNSDPNVAPAVYNTSATWIPMTEIWTIQLGWVVVYFFSVIALLLLAIADIVWEWKTVSPDFLGFASSVVRTNQQLGREFRGLSGVEKTKAMADMRVMLQDMSSGGDVGKIVLAPFTSGSTRLRKTRSYK